MDNSIVFQFKNKDVLLFFNILLPWCHMQPGSQTWIFFNFTEFRYSPINDTSTYFLHFDIKTDTLYGENVWQIWDRSAEMSVAKFEVENLRPELFSKCVYCRSRLGNRQCVPSEERYYLVKQVVKSCHNQRVKLIHHHIKSLYFARSLLHIAGFKHGNYLSLLCNIVNSLSGLKYSSTLAARAILMLGQNLTHWVVWCIYASLK